MASAAKPPATGAKPPTPAAPQRPAQAPPKPPNAPGASSGSAPAPAAAKPAADKTKPEAPKENNLAAKQKSNSKIVESLPGAGAKDEDPYGDQDWIKRKTQFKVANGTKFDDKAPGFDREFVEAHNNDTSSDSDEERERLAKLPSTKKFAYLAQLNKRADAKKDKNRKLPEDISVVMDDMDDHMQDQCIAIVRESVEKFPNSEDDGSLRAKFIKNQLDQKLQPSWMVACVPDQFWVGASFEPGHTFSFELNDIVYMMWRTPSTQRK